MGLLKSGEWACYICLVEDGGKTYIDHYAERPGQLMVYRSTEKPEHGNPVPFGPKNPDDWGQTTRLPACAKFVGIWELP